MLYYWFQSSQGYHINVDISKGNAETAETAEAAEAAKVAETAEAAETAETAEAVVAAEAAKVAKLPKKAVIALHHKELGNGIGMLSKSIQVQEG